MTFAHLHLHSEYSLLDGMIRFPSLIKYLQENGMTSCAITDHGWIAGLVAFYKACKKASIKPILGVEAYITINQDNIEKNEDKRKDNYHLVLLAKDHIGYEGLLRLCSEAALHNFYYKPRIYLPKLEQLKGHVFALSACLAGVMTPLAHFDQEKKEYTDPNGSVLIRYNQLCACLGKENLFLELQDWDDGTGVQPAWNKFLLQFSKEVGAELVITTDAHYLKEEDHETHELMMAMQLKTTLDRYREGSTMRYGPHFWVKPPNMMLESAKRLGCEAAYHNTTKIAEQCNVEIELGKYYPPKFKPEEAKDFEEFQRWLKKQNRKLDSPLKE